MSGYYNSKNPRIPTVNVAMDGQFVSSRGRTTHTSFAETLDSLDSTLIRYLRSGSPASPTAPSTGEGFTTSTIDAGRIRPMLDVNKYIHSKNSSFGYRGSSSSWSPQPAFANLSEHLPSISTKVFTTRTKDEEEVLVMDGIPVGSVPGGRFRLSSESGGSSLSGNSFNKTEICRAWVDPGSCRYGPKCQVQICKSYATTGFCIYGSKCKFDHQPATATAAEAAGREVAAANRASPFKPEQGSGNWLPRDDCIEITLPSAMGEEEDAYIQSVLHGPSRRKRLQVFAEICPEHYPSFISQLKPPL